jgi:hypothetical protein
MVSGTCGRCGRFIINWKGGSCPHCGAYLHANHPFRKKGPGCLIAAAVVALFIVAFIFLAWSYSSGVQRDVRAETARILDLLGTGKTSEVYSTTASDYRAWMDEVTFTATVRKLDLEGYKAWNERGLRYESKPTAWVVEGNATVMNNRVVPLRMKFVQDERKWRLSSIERREPPPGTLPGQ